MKKMMIWSALAFLALALATTQAFAVGVQAPGGTPGGPKPWATPTGTWVAGPGSGLQPSMGQPTAGVPVNGLPEPAQTAQARVHGKPMIYRGTVSAMDANGLTLTLSDGSSITIGLTSETRIMIPGPKTQTGGSLVGMNVVVLAFADENGNPVARMVLAIPGQPSLVHRVGTVTAYTAGSSITIMASDGNEYTFALTSATKILPAERAGELAVSSRVTIIAPRDPGANGWTASGIVVQPAS